MKTKNFKCIWCGASGPKKFHERIRWEDLYSSWYRCAKCQSLIIWPRPSKSEIARVYEEDYLNKKHQPHAGVDCRVRYAPEYRPTVFTEYEMSLKDLKVSPESVKSILDFGCADGVFLEFCQKYFRPSTKLYGTDLSESLLTQAKNKGWNVFPLAETDRIGMKFDLITLWDVIEHVEEPLEVLNQLKKLLTPRGRICMQTPRFGILGELYGRNWPHLLPVQHLSLASKEGMEAVVKRAGLTIDAYCTFGSNSPANLVPQPYKRIFDQLAKKLGFGDVQIISLKRK